MDAIYTAEGASLTAASRVQADRLEIQYSVTNTSASPLYVLDAAVILGPHGETKVETAKPAVEFLPPGTVVLSDKLIPLPPGTLTTVPRSAYAFRIEPGETHSRNIELNLPLRDRHPAKSAPSPRTVSCTRLRFEVGIIHPGGDVVAQEQEIAGTRLWRLNTAAYHRQHVLSIESALLKAIPLETAE